MGKVSDLPNELLRYLFLRLSPKDRKRAVLVEQRWRKIGEDPVLWKWSIIVINNGEDINKLFVKRINHVQEIKVNYKIDWKAEQLEELFKGTLVLPKLKEIDGVTWVDLSSVNSELVGKALGKLEKIRLYGNHTTNEQIFAVFTEMSRNDCIKKLFLLRMDLSSLDLEEGVLAQVVSNLQELSLGNVALNNDQVQELFQSVSESKKLTTIFLGPFDVSSIESELFGKAMANLEEVIFESVAVSAQQMKEFFSEMTKYGRLKEFDSMEGNVNMSQVDPKLFARVVSKLEKFHLSETSVTDEQVLALFTELKQNCKLNSLFLPRYSNLSSIDPNDLATIVNSMEEMYLDHADLSSDQITAILKQVQKNTRLKALYFMGVNISDVDPELVTTAKDILKDLYIENEEGDDIFIDIDGANDTDSESDADLIGQE